MDPILHVNCSGSHLWSMALNWLLRQPGAKARKSSIFASITQVMEIFSSMHLSNRKKEKKKKQQYATKDWSFHVRFKAKGGNRSIMEISHLLLLDDIIIISDSNLEQLGYLQCVLGYKVVSSLKVNLEKSDLVPVGEVNVAMGFASVLGCEVKPSNAIFGIAFGLFF